MRKVIALTWREISSYFLSPVAYIVLTVFLLFSGFFFYVTMIEASMRGIMSIISFIALLTVPMITMRLLAEETRSGTVEMLLTAPVTDFQVILSKFLGAMAFYCSMLLPTGIYVIILAKLGDLDPGPVFTGYLGLLLLGGVFMSAGIFTSTLTSNQIVAAITALIGLLMLWILGAIPGDTPGVPADFLRYVGIIGHLASFAKGVIDTRDVVYYVTVTGFFLFISIRVLESRKWR